MNPQAYQGTPSLQVCQPGFDVRNCPDWAYLLNSDWPSLAIAWEDTIPNPVSSVTLDHNLGFPPLTMMWPSWGTYGYGRVSTGMTVNKSQLIISPSTNATNLTIRAFNIDISTEAEYRLPTSAQAKLPYNNQFGAKQAKNNRLITSNNLNDFIFHSRSQAPAVLTVATQKGQYFTNTNPGSQYAGPWIVYPIKTSYVPWVYCATENAGSYSFETVNGLEFIGGNIVMPLIGNAGGSLIILRDPLFYPNTVRVVY